MELKNLNKIMNEWGKYIVQQSRTRLTKGKQNVSQDLYRSLKYKIAESATSISVLIEMLDYGVFQDKGVRGKIASPINTKDSPFRYKDKMPPVQTIADWAKAKNIRLRDDKGRFAKGNYNTIGYLIARSIRDKGIKATFFLTRSYQLSTARYLPRALRGLAEDIGKQIVKNHKQTQTK